MEYIVTYTCYTVGNRDAFPGETSACVDVYPDGRESGYKNHGTFDNVMRTSDGPFETKADAVEAAKKDKYVTSVTDGTVPSDGYTPYPLLWEMRDKVHPKYRKDSK